MSTKRIAENIFSPKHLSSPLCLVDLYTLLTDQPRNLGQYGLGPGPRSPKNHNTLII